METVDKIWQYSHYYGDMVATAVRLHLAEEDYAAMLILFNVMELIFKSVRENYSQNITDDLEYLKSKKLLSENEYMFLNNKENGVRCIRNIMMHRNAYQYCLENEDGIALPFADAGTWIIVYNLYAPKIITILENVLDKANIVSDEK